ncbi:hypothetical protein, partial [Lactiplantibacillus plantarum]|uniref:hypothetical protein n=1 Tax=Lactiplantibacillus plantarum TaxID=1590 RepID=UPI000AD9C7C6
TGLEKSEDFSRPVLFLETYVTASFLGLLLSSKGLWQRLTRISAKMGSMNLLVTVYLSLKDVNGCYEVITLV